MAEMALIFYVINLSVLILTGVLLAAMPYYTGKSLLFGVRIPQIHKNHPAVIVLKRNFSLLIGLFVMILMAAVTFQYLFAPKWSIFTSVFAPFALVFFQIIAYVPSWKKARKLKKENQWVVSFVGSADTNMALSRQTFSRMPWYWYISGFALCIIFILISFMVYPKIPETMVTHWNARMQPDDWSQKSYLSVLSIPMIAMGMNVIMLFSNMMVWRMKLQVNQENPALSFAQHRKYRLLLSHVLGLINLLFCVLLLFFGGMTLELWLPDSNTVWALFIGTTAVSILIPVAFSIWAGQAGNKLKPKVLPEDERSAGLIPKNTTVQKPSFQDDRYWILGMFYYNREDPTLFVEDRFGTNGGLNYARPMAWVFVVLIAGLTIATLVLTTVIMINQM